jgi:hypothetical protein
MSVERSTLIIWWATNTRACSVVATLALHNDIDLAIILDPNAPLPPSQIQSKSKVIQREFKDLTRVEFENIISDAEKHFNNKNSVLAPTSEYLMSVVYNWNKEKKFNNLVIPFNSRFSYDEISSKIFLYQSNLIPVKRLPKIINNKDVRNSIPFFAKPKRNIVEGINLKPFKVGTTRDLERYEELQQSYFAQSFIKGKSFYLCGYVNKQGQLITYIQKNLIQNGENATVILAYFSNSHRLFKYTEFMEDFINEIGFRGPFMAEFKGKKNLLIEINPRFWGPLLLDLRNGSKILREFFNDFFGVNVNVPPQIIDSKLYYVPGHILKSRKIIKLKYRIVKLFFKNSNWNPNILGGDW